MFKVPAGGTVSFSVEWQVLQSAAAVRATTAEIASIQKGRRSTVDMSSPML